MSRIDADYLLYAMTHVARLGGEGPDKDFAAQMAAAARDPRYRPPPAQLDRMRAVERRFYQERDQT